jgi:hypothetical protein
MQWNTGGYEPLGRLICQHDERGQQKMVFSHYVYLWHQIITPRVYADGDPTFCGSPPMSSSISFSTALQCSHTVGLRASSPT